MNQTMKRSLKAALTLPLQLAGMALMLAGAAGAQTLPAPYVSRALDAVLMPITADVQRAFGLARDEVGVLVLAVQPGGVADYAGVLPGDVISQVYGKRVRKPIDLDTIVYYWLTQNIYDFTFDGWRAGTVYTYFSDISMESYIEVIDIVSVETWSSWSYESFSYSEYYAEYASEITESYATSESYIEETVTSEEFISEVSEETTSDEMATEEGTDETMDSDSDGTMDAADTDDDNDGVDDAADGDDNGDGVDAGADDGGDDAGADDGGDDAGADDGGDDAGADDGGGDE